MHNNLRTHDWRVLFPFHGAGVVFSSTRSTYGAHSAAQRLLKNTNDHELNPYSSSLEVILGLFTFGFHGTIRNRNAAFNARRQIFSLTRLGTVLQVPLSQMPSLKQAAHWYSPVLGRDIVASGEHWYT